MVIEMISDQVSKLEINLIGHQMCMEKQNLRLSVNQSVIKFNQHREHIRGA